MRNFPVVSLSVLAALAMVGQASANGNSQLQGPVAVSGVTGSVPFDLYQGYFTVVHGSMGPLKNLNFFLDTGTSPAVLDSRVARKLNLRSGDPVSIAILGGRAAGEETNLPSLSIGPVQHSNLPVVVTDLSFFRKVVPIRIDAIVGLDVLGQEPFVIDYSARAIRFGASPPLPVSVPLRLDKGLAVFDAEIDHRSVHLLLDTGASSLILFRKLTAQDSGASVNAVLGTKEIGSYRSQPVWLRMLRLGPAEFRKEPALLTLNPKPSQFDFDGLISPTALGVSQVTVNIARGQLGFSR